MTRRRKRNPNGVVQSKPIALRLPAQELALHNSICGVNELTLSALAYDAYKAGLPLVLEKLTPADSPSAVPQDAATNTSPLAASLFIRSSSQEDTNAAA